MRTNKYINNKISNFRKSFSGITLVVLIIILNVIISAVVYSSVTIPYSFSEGDLISAEQINANFQAFKTKIDELDSNQIPVGTINTFAGDASGVPSGWLLCDGTAVNRTGLYANLYAVIGNKWGAGDQSTTFNLPDLRGRFLRGVDGGTGNDPDASSRNALYTGGNTGNNVGSFQEDTMQGHFHNTMYRASGAGDELSILPPMGDSSATIGTFSVTGPVSDGLNGTPRTSSETRPKNAAVNFIIKY